MVTTVFAASAGTPVNVPVKVTLPVDSAALSTLSAVTASTVNPTELVSGATVSTIPVPGKDTFPAGSVAVAVTASPFNKPPGFGTLQTPVTGSAVTCSVLPFGKVTLTVEPGSAVPVIGSTALIGFTTGAFGATVSIVIVPVAVPTFPAGSVAVTVTVCGPSVSAGKVLSARVQVPLPLLVAG